MPDDQNSSRWPELLKYSAEFRHLFPRTEERDQELEQILSICVPAKGGHHIEADLIEASRRLREAVQHDAYLRWTPDDKKKLANVFASLKKSLDALGQLTSHQHKAILLATVSDGQIETNLDKLRYRIQTTFDQRDRISEKLEELEGLRRTTARTATRPFSLIERLVEAWRVMSGNKPSTRSSTYGTQAGPFESCLQQAGEHLNLKDYNEGRPFSARSALQAFYDHLPPPDNI